MLRKEEVQWLKGSLHHATWIVGVAAFARPSSQLSRIMGFVRRSYKTRRRPEEDYEVRYWSEKFGVSHEELTKAVARVGRMTEA